ncbi:hypothetical protein PGT21_037169 [Puccinia graminis f. sp. tritici]|uniref:RING-type domain-containing protein n=1 Tax=Puccinia graminis f. sp. tritici TaxID=56615 RepID=A0A5B0R5E2_PUCGR|nr:hypothetical protein PGT21_037169 [Puccinia graminis f. sp. tritici]
MKISFFGICFCLMPMTLQFLPPYSIEGEIRSYFFDNSQRLHHISSTNNFQYSQRNVPNRQRTSNHCHIGAKMLKWIHHHFSHCISNRQGMTDVDESIYDYTPGAHMHSVDYLPPLSQFDETEKIKNTVLLGYMPRDDYLSHAQELDETSTHQVSSTPFSENYDQSGGSGIGTSSNGLKVSTHEFGRTRNTLNLEENQSEILSEGDKEGQLQQKIHNILPLKQVIEMIGASEARRIGDSGILTSETAGGSRERNRLKIDIKDTEYCTNSCKETKNQDRISTSHPSLMISGVLLGDPDDQLCTICQHDFQGPQHNVKNKLSVDSFEKIYMIKGCGHYFHHNCLQNWILGAQKKTCPTCRHPVQHIEK